VVQQYHRHEQRTVDEQRWFSSGDVASIDQHGTMKISDRCVHGFGSTRRLFAVARWVDTCMHGETHRSHPVIAAPTCQL
jgi:acyl-CoA synthetase (AMP-forming)/AMP-acid ligase II